MNFDKLNKYNYVFEGDSVENGSSKSVAIIGALQKIIQNYILRMKGYVLESFNITLKF